MNTLVVSSWRCQFCHRCGDEALQMIAGDSGFICTDCVQSCAQLLRASTPTPDTQPAHRYVYQRLSAHFAPALPQDALATTRTYPVRQQADLQRALDGLFGERHIPSNFVGIHSDYAREAISFSKLVQQSRSPVEAAPEQYEEVAIGRGQTVRCLRNGVWFLREDETPYAVVLGFSEGYGQPSSIRLEVAAPAGPRSLAVSARIFAALERELSQNSCYRGRVLSLEEPYQWSGHATRIVVHDLAPVRRSDVILPERTLQLLERNILGFAAQRMALRALGLSTQKGLLLHGAPGTGKTHCIRYLAGQLTNHTTLLITAEGVGLLPEYIALARLLQPALVVIEDADLIARERTEMHDACSEVMLNRLLNELDGLREQVDVFFVLTTNRPGALEPALANRPGRIDQTIEFPLPDEALRTRLLHLYAHALPIEEPLVQDLTHRTAGASPAFIKELMRRIAQHHLASGMQGSVTATTAEEALHEMLFSGGALNVALLGGTDVKHR